MSDVTTETRPAKTFNPEAFALNLAKARESSAKALAAYLKPRDDGEPKDKPPSELGEVIRTFSTVADYWLSDQTRAAELQMKLGKAYLDLWGSSMRRLIDEEAPPTTAPAPRDKRFADPEWKVHPVLRFRDAGLSAVDEVGERSGARSRRARPAHPQESRVLRPADPQRAGAVEFRPHQSGSAARDAGLQRRQSGARHANAGGGYRSRRRKLADPAVRPVQSRSRRQ